MHEYTVPLDMATTDYRKEGLGNEKWVDSLGVAGSDGYHLDTGDHAFPGCSSDAEIGKSWYKNRCLNPESMVI